MCFNIGRVSYAEGHVRLTLLCTVSSMQYLFEHGRLCLMCLNTLMISALSDWLADGVDLSDSAVCQAGSASALENMSEGADN